MNTATTEAQISGTVFLLESQRLHRDWKLAGILCQAAVSCSRLCCILGTGPGTEWTAGDFAPSHAESSLARHSPRSCVSHRQNSTHLLKKPWSNTLKDSQHYLATLAGLLYILQLDGPPLFHNTSSWTPPGTIHKYQGYLYQSCLWCRSVNVPISKSEGRVSCRYQVLWGFKCQFTAE